MAIPEEEDGLVNREIDQMDRGGLGLTGPLLISLTSGIAVERQGG